MVSKVSTRSVLNFFQDKNDSDFDFDCIFDLFERLIQIFVNRGIVEDRHTEFENLVSDLLELKNYNQKWTTPTSC